MAAPNPPSGAVASSGSAAPVGKAAVAAPDPLVALHGRRVVLGVTGGIAAYKAVDVCRRLVDAGAHVVPVLTDDAQRFIGALTFSALASERVRSSLSGAGYPATSAEISMEPTTKVEITDEKAARQVLGFVERLEELEDVQNVYANFDLPDALMEQLEASVA